MAVRGAGIFTQGSRQIVLPLVLLEVAVATARLPLFASVVSGLLVKATTAEAVMPVTQVRPMVLAAVVALVQWVATALRLWAVRVVTVSLHRLLAHLSTTAAAVVALVRRDHLGLAATAVVALAVVRVLLERQTLAVAVAAGIPLLATAAAAS